MTQLRKMMLEELQRRNYSNGTIRHHLRAVKEFANHYGKSPDKLGLNELRSYQAYLLQERDWLSEPSSTTWQDCASSSSAH
jgi:integrase/recombinase XerD